MPQYSCGISLHCRWENSSLHHHNILGVFGGIFDLLVFNSFFKKESVSGLGQAEFLEEDKRLHISLESFCAY